MSILFHVKALSLMSAVADTGHPALPMMPGTFQATVSAHAATNALPAIPPPAMFPASGVTSPAPALMASATPQHALPPFMRPKAAVPTPAAPAGQIDAESPREDTEADAAVGETATDEPNPKKQRKSRG